MNIFPIWKTTTFPTTDTNVTFRIMKWGTEEIYRGRGFIYPDEDLLEINLNKPSQNHIDSMIWEALGATGDTVANFNAYAEFALQFFNDSTDQWTTVYEFAMVNDWSYEDMEGNVYSDPINGHACPGMILPFSYLVTGDTAETICYEEYEFLARILFSPSTIIFPASGGTATVTATSNASWHIESNPCGYIVTPTTGTNGTTTITITAPENLSVEQLNCDITFIATNEHGPTTVTLGITQSGATPYLTVTSGDNAKIGYEGGTWTMAYSTNLPAAYYSMTGDNGYSQTGYTSGGTISFVIPSGDTDINYTINFYDSIGGTLLETAHAKRLDLTPYFTVTSGNNEVFYNTGGTWTVTYDTNYDIIYFTFSGTGISTVTGSVAYGDRLPLTIPSGNTTGNYGVTFYSSPGTGLLGTATCKRDIIGMDQYLHFDVISGGTLNINGNYSPKKKIYFKINNGNWTGRDYSDSIQLSAGDTIYFKGNNASYGTGSASGSLFKTYTNDSLKCNVAGNIMSLFYGDDFTTATAFTENYACQWMFDMRRALISAEGLLLPATKLMPYCYAGLFDDCIELKKAPAVLPATAMTEGCYWSMFAETAIETPPEILAEKTARNACQYMFTTCYSLTTAPVLHATAVTEGCYNEMFKECTSLTAAPSLPAMTMAKNCYAGMFSGCTALTTAPALPATTIAYGCYSNMFENCTSLTTAPSILPAMTIEYACYKAMFKGCTSLTTAPELPAETLLRDYGDGYTYYCYEEMFSGCTVLSYIKCLAKTRTQSGYSVDVMKNWVKGVASNGTFVKAANVTWDTGNNGIPTNWTVQTAT